MYYVYFTVKKQTKYCKNRNISVDHQTFQSIEEQLEKKL